MLYENAWDLLYPPTEPLFNCTTHGCLIGAWHRITSNQSLRASATVVVCTFFFSLDSREATTIQHQPDQAPVETVTACCDGRWTVTWVCHTQANMAIVPVAIRTWVGIHGNTSRSSIALHHVLLGAFTLWLENACVMPHTVCDTGLQSPGCCINTITYALLFCRSSHGTMKRLKCISYTVYMDRG